METARCSRCGEEKPLDQYNRSERSGRMYYCRPCAVAYTQERRARLANDVMCEKCGGTKAVGAQCKSCAWSEELRCPKCGVFKSPGEYYKNERLQTGVSTWCKNCTRGYHKLRRVQQKVQTREMHRDMFILKDRVIVLGWQLNQLEAQSGLTRPEPPKL